MTADPLRRFRRWLSRPVNVHSFGADPTGIDRLNAAIQAALNKADSRHGMAAGPAPATPVRPRGSSGGGDRSVPARPIRGHNGGGGPAGETEGADDGAPWFATDLLREPADGTSAPRPLSSASTPQPESTKGRAALVLVPAGGSRRTATGRPRARRKRAMARTGYARREGYRARPATSAKRYGPRGATSRRRRSYSGTCAN